MLKSRLVAGRYRKPGVRPAQFLREAGQWIGTPPEVPGRSGWRGLRERRFARRPVRGPSLQRQEPRDPVRDGISDQSRRSVHAASPHADCAYLRSLESASIDLIAAIRAVGIVAIRRIAVAAETVAKFATLMAAMETTEVSGHVAATEAAAKMTAAETATMAPTTAAASECGS